MNDDTYDDTSLLRTYVDDASHAAFAELVQRHIGLVYHTALRQLANPSLAEDVTQIVFTRLAQKAPSLVRHPSLIGWLHTTTRFAAHETHRAESRRHRREQEAHAMQDLPDATPPDTEWEHLRPVIDDALGELGEADRAAVLLRYFTGLPLAAVGARLNVSENAARMRIDRALGKLQLALARRGVTSTASALATVLGQQTAFAAPAGFAATITGTVLAQIAATSATALPLLPLMATTKFTTIVAASIAALALGTAVHQSALKRAAESALAAQTREAARLSERLQQAEQHSRDVPPPPVGSEPVAASLPKVSPPPASRARNASLDEAIDHLVVTHPTLSSLFMRQETIRFRSKYGPLYHALGFSPEQIARFESVLTEHAQAKSDIQVAGITKGLKRDDPAVQELLVQAGHQRDARVRALLGEADYPRYQEFERTSRGRALSQRLASEFYYTSQPLTAAQGEAMARIAIENSAPVTGTGMAGWDNMIAQAQTVLSPNQLDALREMKEQAELGLEIHQITGPVSRQFANNPDP